MTKKPKGWRQETARHSLAARGIKTGSKKKKVSKAMTYRNKLIAEERIRVGMLRMRKNHAIRNLARAEKEGPLRPRDKEKLEEEIWEKNLHYEAARDALHTLEQTKPWVDHPYQPRR